MSRPQHRKSQSTSALSIIASSPARPSRSSKEKSRGGLERVEEVPSPRRRGSHDSQGNSRAGADGGGGSTPGSRRKNNEGSSSRAGSAEDVRGWMNDNIEETLLRCCTGGPTGIDLTEFLSLGIHTNLLMLLTRHTQLLTSRANSYSSLHSTDETAISLVPELTAVFGLLQGLCLLNSACKSTCAEEWTMEMLIDLLLLLRSIPASQDHGNQPLPRPVVYHILELLLCILVDSPEYSRRFERLSGLEAVTRVLKGSSVSKEVRMKCIEFLYFYLLPEHQSRSLSSSTRSVSSSTSRSTSSNDSLYPPSPLTSHTRPSPTIVHPHAPHSPKRVDDLDLHFVPQTPRKKVTPNLGYLTPSSRRVSGSSSSKTTPVLQTVPASPVDSGSLTPKAEKRGSMEDAEVGLGLGLPNPSSGGGMKRDVTAIHLGALVSSPESSSSRRSDSQDRRTPPTPLSSGKLSRSSTQPNLNPTQNHQHQRQNSVSIRKTSRSPLVQSSIPESPKPIIQISGEGRDQTKRRQSRTSLYPTSDTGTDPGLSDASTSTSARSPRIRTSRTSSQLSLHSDSPSSPQPPVPQLPRIRHSMTSTNLSSGLSDPQTTTQVEKSPRMRHSRTSSHLSALSPTLPSTTPALQINRSPSGFLAPTPSVSRNISSGDTSGIQRTPSKARRAFPSELTRGMLPTPPPISPKSTPLPLGNSKRLPSISGRSASVVGLLKLGEDVKEKEVRSVEEKKELLGQWLGNVDALVSGVEGVGWWGAQGKT